MPEQGDTLICRLDKGGKLEVTLEDRVYPDRSAGQYEAGWWVFNKEAPFVNYFINERGLLWDFERATGNFTKVIGIHVPWAKMVKKANLELESLIRDEEYRRSFDAYR